MCRAPTCSTARATKSWPPRAAGRGLLYEEQTRRGVSSHHWQEFEDVADHCTICHKCFAVPGEDRLWRRHHGHAQPAGEDGQKRAGARQQAGHGHTQRHQPDDHQRAARGHGERGLSGTAPGRRRDEGGGQASGDAPAGHGGHGADQGAGDPLRQQEAARRPADQDGARAAGHQDKDYVPIIRNPQTSADSEAVFYFPGCGSERLFSQVGLATQAMLWHAGVQTVLPPGYLCCGYPQRGNNLQDKAEKMITDNRVLFHRVATTLNYLDIKTVVVSCGTCYDQLQGYEFDKIFPAAASSTSTNTCWKRASPCRGPGRLPVPRALPQPDETGRFHGHRACAGGRQGAQERALLRRIGHAGRLAPGHLRPRCASERPRKSARARRQLRSSGAVGAQDNVKILTSCPSCLQGISRYENGCPGPARSRLHRHRMAKQIPGRELAARVRGAGQRRRH